MWLKNTSGVPDSMLSFAVGGFLAVVIAILLSALDGSSFTFWSQQFKISSPDTTLVTALLGATLLAYVSRRNKKLEAETSLEKLKIKLKNEKV